MQSLLREAQDISGGRDLLDEPFWGEKLEFSEFGVALSP